MGTFTLRQTSSLFMAVALALLGGWPGGVLHADPIGGESPCLSCTGTSSSDSTDTSAPNQYLSSGSSFLSLSEGNLGETVPVTVVRSSAGPTVDFYLTYNSYLADSSQGGVTTVLGRGWTHSFNVLLFEYQRNMFRLSATGRAEKYRFTGGSVYTPTSGHHDSLTRLSSTVFELVTKEKSTYRFERISPAPPYTVQGIVYVLTRITDRDGDVTTLSYANGLLTQIQDAWGRIISLTYNADKRIASVTDPLGRVTTFQYEGAGSLRLSRITDPNGHQIRYTYNASLQLATKIDKNGRTYTYLYNGAKKPYAIRDHSGTTQFSLANPANWAINQQELLKNQERKYTPSTTTQTDGNGKVWRYTYNEDGYLTSIKTPDNFTTTYAYDPVSRRVSTVTDPLGRITAYQYDSRGNVIKVTDPLGHVTTFTYHPVYDRRTSMTDSNGNTSTYTYDANGNLTSQTDPGAPPSAGGTQTWTYDSHGNLLTETDRNGNTTTYTYDAAGNRVSRVDADGFTTTYGYDAVGNLISETDPLLRTTTYAYDGMNRLIQTINPGGGTTQWAYDGNGNVVQKTDANGVTTTYQYDPRNRLVKTVDGLGHATSQAYDGNDNLVSHVDPKGNTTTYQYDAQNRMIRRTDANGAITTYAYDNANNLISQTDPHGHTTTYAYDGLDRRTQIIDAAGGTTTFAYDGPGGGGCCGANQREIVTRKSDAKGHVTHYEYDALYRLVKEVRKEESADVGPDHSDPTPDATDAVTSFTHDANGNRLSMTDPAGLTTTYAYDSLNRLTTVTNNAGEMTTYTYDAVGNTSSIGTPGGNTTSYTYDARDYLTTVTDSVGPVVTYTYDAVGNVLTQTDGSGHTTTFAYDALYRLTSTTDPLGQATTYTYDAVGNVVTVVDREGRATTYTYDAVNRRIAFVDALGHATSYTYDIGGNLTALTDANGHTTQYQYDALHRPILESYADAKTRTFAYDAVGNVVSRTDQLGQTMTYQYNDLNYLTKRDFPSSADDTYTYDPAGRLLTADRGGWNVTFDYDPVSGRRTESVQNGQSVQYAYDMVNRTRVVTYPSGRVITEQRDLRERLAGVTDAPLPIPALATYGYDFDDFISTRSHRNGTDTTYLRNGNHWIVSLKHALGLTETAHFSYNYDHEGNSLVKEDVRNATLSEEYQYDALDRLVDYKSGALVGGTIPVPTDELLYNLDPVGNWDILTINGVPQVRTHNNVNEILTMDATAVLHGDTGNLTEDALYKYAYDEENRLVEVTRKSDNEIVGTYLYDALGRRVVKWANPAGVMTETRYYYDDARIIEEQDSASTVLATYVYGAYVDEVLTMDRGGQTYYYHPNAIWSTVALTDSAGVVQERYTYDPYGRPTVRDAADVPVPLSAWGTAHSPLENPFRFTGRQYDEETGLHHYRARAYDDAKGRFLQRDALGYIDGPNLYEYGRSNPAKYVDPNGQYSVSIPSTRGRNQFTKSEFKWLIKDLDWSRWGQWGGAWHEPLPGIGTLRYNGTLDNAEKAWANIGLHGVVDANNPKKFESVQLSPFASGGTSGGSSWTNSNYNWTVQKTNIKSEPKTDPNGEECHIMTGNVTFIDGNASTISSSFSITGKAAVGGEGAPGAEVAVGFTYSETVTVNVTRTSYSASFRQKICPCGAANSDLFDFRKFGPRLDKWGNSYAWYHDIELSVENSEQRKPLNKVGMW